MGRLLRLVSGIQKFETDWSYAYIVHEKALRLLHPLMPFLTEELWQRLEIPGKSIALAAYPVFDAAEENREASEQMAVVQTMVTEARTIRADNKIDEKRKVTAVTNRALDEAPRMMIERLANITLEYDAALKQSLRLDIPVDRARLAKENEQLEKQIAAFENQFSNEEFLAKAPEKVVTAMRVKRAEYEKKLAENLAALAG